MTTSFRVFLVEGGAATKQWNTERATKADIEAALEFVAKTTDIDQGFLKNSLLGSGRTTIGGFKSHAGDIDLAMPRSDYDPLVIHDKMMKAVNDEGSYAKQNNIGSYAVPVDGKKVQVDLMYVPHREWALWMYHSAEGENSKYPGVMRNLLISTLVSHSLNKVLSTNGVDVYADKDGKSIRIFDKKTGNEVVRAGLSMKFDAGLLRKFEVAPLNARTGARTKTMKNVGPEEVHVALKELGISDLKFDDKHLTVSDPGKAVTMIFGKGAKPNDFMTPESIIHWMHDNLTEAKCKEIFKRTAELLDERKLDKTNRPYELITKNYD